MPRGRPRHDDILTPREWQVLRLIRDGLTNEQIAERLGISLSAAKYHVGEILARLDVSSRHEAVQRAEEQKRGLLALAPLAWLARQDALKPLLVAVAAMTVAALALALFLIAPWSTPGDGHEASLPSDTQLGPDLAPEGLEDYERARLTTPYKHTVLLAASLPTTLSSEDTALVASLPRVSTLRQLQAVLTDEINLIVIDQSAAGELQNTDFLIRQLEAGRAVVELNVCFDQVHYRGPAPPATPYAGEVTEIAPDGTVRKFTVDPAQRPPSTCTLPLASGQVPFFAFRRLLTPSTMPSSLGGSNSVVNLSRGSGLLKHVISQFDAALAGNPLVMDCESAMPAGLQEYFCPDTGSGGLR